MSHPEPRYLGDGGEASATFRPDDAPPDIYQSGGTADYLAGRRRRPVRAVPLEQAPSHRAGPHYHRTMAESFYVLVGTVKIYDGASGSTAAG
jgi:hypothetical protein